jgi:L-malate glycosyltransferase
MIAIDTVVASQAERGERAPRSVVIVGPLPPPSGGMANQTRQLARLLAEEGVRVTLVQTNAAYRPAFVARWRGVRAAFRLLPYLVRVWRAAGDGEVMHVMANSGWAWHLFAAPAVWIGAARGARVIVNYRGGEAGTFFEREYARVAPTLRRAAAVVVPSTFLQRVFTRWNVRTEIVPNIVDLALFSPAASRGPGLDLLVARNLEDIYDVGTAIRAFALVRRVRPEARLVVAGSGPCRADLERLAAELGVADAVHFTGRLDNERMAEQYRRAAILLNPSLADNMPISLLEAMASGTPIVSTDVGGIPDLVEHGKTALLVRPRDPDAMAAEALRVAADPALADRLRAAGLEAASRYTWKSVRPRLFAAYAHASSATCEAAP